MLIKSPFTKCLVFTQREMVLLCCAMLTGIYTVHVGILYVPLRQSANARNVSFQISFLANLHLSTQLKKPNYLVILPTDAAPPYLQYNSFKLI